MARYKRRKVRQLIAAYFESCVSEAEVESMKRDILEIVRERAGR